MCRTGVLNTVQFQFTININERAITTKDQCDLRWNGFPECTFGDKACLFNVINSMDKYSVRCHLNAERIYNRLLANGKEHYISSIPITINQVDDLPLCSSTSECMLHVITYVHK